jgi:hypothetical protein
MRAVRAEKGHRRVPVPCSIVDSAFVCETFGAGGTGVLSQKHQISRLLHFTPIVLVSVGLR